VGLDASISIDRHLNLIVEIDDEEGAEATHDQWSDSHVNNR
jgi:hypothetical protein